MKDLRFGLLMIMLVFSTSILAQRKIVSCEKYDEKTGKPEGVYSSWDASADAPYVYFVFDNDGSKLKGEIFLYVDIYDKSSGDYEIHDTRTMEVSENKKWAMFDYDFSEGGKYQISAADEDGNILASTFVTINWEGEKADTKKSTDDNPAEDTYYYENSTISFCKSVDDEGNMIGESEVFNLGRTGQVEVAVYLDMDGEPIETEKIIATVYQDGDKLDDFEYEVQKEWNWVKFVLTFKEKGSYSVDIYNEEDTFINTASVTIE